MTTTDPTEIPPDDRIVRAEVVDLGIRNPAVGWHRHRWTPWGKPFGTKRPGAFTSFTASDDPPPWWQERTCTVCKRAQRVLVGAA